MTNASNTTQYYQLSLWEDDDLVRRQDFNSDHTAIDTALHGLDTDITALEGANTAQTAALSAHSARTDNPHGVTLAQLGAAASGHVHAAEAITFDGTDSSLSSTNVQDAIEEIKNSIGNFREIYYGSYTGTGSTEQTISLNFTPTAVITFLAHADDSHNTSWWSSLYGSHAALALQNSHVYASTGDTVILQIVNNGFTVVGNSYEDRAFIHTNISGATYHYLALR